MNGPLLLSVNHPNSFLDAIILDILFKQPIWSLARGDVFKKPFYIKLLAKLKMLPVYRTSEGVENLETNYRTFDACKEIFKNNGVVLMFSEGKCINEWHLRPLMKGTARLAISTWQEGIDLKVLPVGINYSSFRRFGKNIFLNFGTIINQEDINVNDTDGRKHIAFNSILHKALQPLVFEIPYADKQLQAKLLTVNTGIISSILLCIPAFIGFFLHLSFYLPVRIFTKAKANHSDHYDSILIALLTILYPVYLLFVTSLLFWITCNWMSLLVPILFPLTARAFVQLKGQLDK